MQILTVGLLYFLLFGVYWFMGKRKIPQLSIMDLIIFLLLSNIITLNIPINNYSFIYALIIIILIFCVQLIIPYIEVIIIYLKNIFSRKPSHIIAKGTLSFKEMIRKHRYLNDLLKQLKEKNIKSVEDVENAHLGAAGKLLVNEYSKDNRAFPIPIILDGMVQYSILKMLNKNEQWVYDMLTKEDVPLNNIFYAFYKEGRVYIIKNE